MPIRGHKTSKRQLSISCKCSEEENDSMISLLEAQCCKRGDPTYISNYKAASPSGMTWVDRISSPTIFPP